MILNCQNITKSFTQGPNQIDVLKGASLSLDSKDTLAVVGKSGSGKSTLLSILCGIESVDGGQIHFEDRDITKYSQQEMTALRASSIGVVFQQFHLIEHLNALENTMLPLEIAGDENAREKALSLLESVGLKERALHFPNQLSGGEKQRVAIARAMSNRPKLILADEPSGSLDEETGVSIMNLLFDLVEKEDMGLILVTHEMQLAKRCKRTLVLSQGVLKEGNL
ncbi:ABC transporter ATP-binding protein [Halobacteriovorax marinus]|uniref:ABC transport system, ATP-binding protein n=1 Tax=Halobacteriovorax marinus (strain ATCC BAA-682 / DSM 15412 / SJ) TaxID=862908 RepID=E1WZN3_HALMS|nr:ABC transporter ATP-binding protein [Halobacteriovorax marinus]ATH07588.1 ABC transporter ATP-binding protein [Halobacteriovorax marinus]CBW26219.1 putative ABC transport system, ATP-binding protein [Halobacteriovorax marinus SJ]